MRRRHFAAPGPGGAAGPFPGRLRRGKKAEEERTSGLLLQACGISPDAVLLTVDGPGGACLAVSQPNWLTWGLRLVSEAYDAGGADPLTGPRRWRARTLPPYVRQQALDNTALYATVEKLGGAVPGGDHEANQPELDSLWAKQAEEAGGEEEYLAHGEPGPGRSEAEALCADALPYRKSSPQLSAERQRRGTGGGGRGGLCLGAGPHLTLEWLVVPVTDRRAGRGARQQAASLFSPDQRQRRPVGGLCRFEETYGTGEAGGPSCRAGHPAGGGGKAAETLEEDQWAGSWRRTMGSISSCAARWIQTRWRRTTLTAAFSRPPRKRTSPPLPPLTLWRSPPFYERLTAARDRAEEDGET